MITPVGTSYRLYETSNFTVTAGTHTIEFIGMNPQGGDNTALIDVVSLAAANDQIIDGGFETPALAANTYQADARRLALAVLRIGRHEHQRQLH